MASITYIILNKFWPAKAVPDHWTEDGDQEVIEARLSHVPSDDYERGNWKMNEDHDPKLGSGFRHHKLRSSESPTGSGQF